MIFEGNLQILAYVGKRVHRMLVIIVPAIVRSREAMTPWERMHNVGNPQSIEGCVKLSGGIEHLGSGQVVQSSIHIDAQSLALGRWDA